MRVTYFSVYIDTFHNLGACQTGGGGNIYWDAIGSAASGSTPRPVSRQRGKVRWQGPPEKNRFQGWAPGRAPLPTLFAQLALWPTDQLGRFCWSVGIRGMFCKAPEAAASLLWACRHPANASREAARHLPSPSWQAP